MTNFLIKYFLIFYKLQKLRSKRYNKLSQIFAACPDLGTVTDGTVIQRDESAIIFCHKNFYLYGSGEKAPLSNIRICEQTDILQPV